MTCSSKRRINPDGTAAIPLWRSSMGRDHVTLHRRQDIQSFNIRCSRRHCWRLISSYDSASIATKRSVSIKLMLTGRRFTLLFTEYCNAHPNRSRSRHTFTTCRHRSYETQSWMPHFYQKRNRYIHRPSPSLRHWAMHFEESMQFENINHLSSDVTHTTSSPFWFH